MEPRALPAMADPPPARSLAKSSAWRQTAPATSISWMQAVATAVSAPPRGGGGGRREGGPAPSAQFSEILSLAADGAGNLYIVDASGSNRVRRVSANGIVSTVEIGRASCRERG